MRWKIWLGLAAAAIAAAYVGLVGVTVIHFNRADIAAGYSTVCLQKSTVVPDGDDSRYGCPTTSGLHLWAGEDIYVFLHTGGDGDFTLVCTGGDRRSVQHLGYYSGGTSSEMWRLDTTCDGVAPH
ncbi:hypothetical protein [Asticcacaulis solisilvae]|uniref:hypothetical protein n=1 Tax=Asticcacaulis solisilvae TaxID=1217274 RepID=UPI003FD7592E